MNATPGLIHEVFKEDVFGLLGSRPEGLTDSEVAALRREFGPNRLQSSSMLPWWRSLFKQFVNLFSILLDLASIVCFVADAIEPTEGMALLGWALLAVSVLNALFAFAQEMRAERAMEELRKFLPQICRARRNGMNTEVLVDELVPGDVLLVCEGDRISADARLVESEELLVNNAPLTGETASRSLVSSPGCGRLIESPNIVFAGCSVLRGNGTAVVFATGHNTELGKIATLSRNVGRPLSPLQLETKRMVRTLTVIAVSLGMIFFVYGLASGRSLWVNIVFMLGIIVANVPEGLLPTFTLALSMASVRMAKKQVLVRSLEAVETLGAIHVICTDKTGTLTKNELAITGLYDPVNGRSISDPMLAKSFLRAALIASEVRDLGSHSGSADSEASTHRSGDPLNMAVVEAFQTKFGSAQDIVSKTRRRFSFDLNKRREGGLFVEGQEIQFALKGAWESVRPAVSLLKSAEDKTVAATEDTLVGCDGIVHRLSSQGQRVIAVASRRLDHLPGHDAQGSMEVDLMLHGFLALDDPIREQVPPAVVSCHRAGIRVLLITGDHPDTAEAVARKCRILADDQSGSTRIIVGTELETMREQQLVERLREGAVIFARTAPEQKMKIVLALKRLGNVVGMTGDGINDSPALKAADVGIAMGASGTEVARESADIVLLDDNFASIVAGIEEGRAVYANMQKFTTYVLASNIPEIIPFLLFVTFPVPLALTVIQILTIDLGSDLLPAIGLGQEPPEPNAMNQLPRQRDQRLLSRPLMVTAYLFLGMIQAAYSLLLFFLVLREGGWEWGQVLSDNDPLYKSATGITLASIILMQIGNVVGRRSQHNSGLDRGLLCNRMILVGIAVEVVFSWTILYYPPVQSLLHTAPVAWHFYAMAWFGIPLLFILDFVRKRIATRLTISGLACSF